jgi:hypothetical protein
VHVEKDDQVIRHNNNKTWGDQREKHPESIFVQNISEKLIERLRETSQNGSAEKNLFSFAAQSCFHYSCVYYFCHSPKKMAAVLLSALFHGGFVMICYGVKTTEGGLKCTEFP